MNPYEDLVNGVIEKARELSALVRSGDGEFHLRTLIDIRDWALAAQPVQPGDRVSLIADVDLRQAPGWKPYAELLKAGSVGTVDNLEFSRSLRCWQAGVRFDADPSAGLFYLRVERLQKACDTCGGPS